MNLIQSAAIFSLASAVLACAAHGQTSVEDLLWNRFEQRMSDYTSEVDGAFGYAAIDLTTGRVASRNGDVAFAQASAIKIPILVTLFRDVSQGRLKLDGVVTLTARDAVGGSGGLQDKIKTANQTLTLRELALLMIRDSDNTATNVLIAKVGMERVNALMTELGMKSTRLRRVMMDAQAALRGDENASTPLEMARLAAMIHRGEVAGAGEIVSILKTVKAAVRQAVPARVEVASKPGGIPGVNTETAIVYLEGRPFVFTAAGTALAEGISNPVQRAAGIAFDHFERLARTNAYGHRVR
ncbi:MAG: serine hydrolase [Bryobacteraceae bacterium]|nr:serine hydrolase [Bryobacteraceae bacterium]